MTGSIEYWIPIQQNPQKLTKKQTKSLQDVSCGLTLAVTNEAFYSVCHANPIAFEDVELEVSLTNEQIQNAAKSNIFPNQKLYEVKGPLKSMVINAKDNMQKPAQRVATYRVTFDATFSRGADLQRASDLEKSGLFQPFINGEFQNHPDRFKVHYGLNDFPIIISKASYELNTTALGNTVIKASPPSSPAVGVPLDTCVFDHPGFESKTEFENFIENKSGPANAVLPFVIEEFMDPNSFRCDQKFELLKTSGALEGGKTEEQLCGEQLQYGYEVEFRLSDGSIFTGGGYTSWDTYEYPVFDPIAYPFPNNAGLSVKVLATQCRFDTVAGKCDSGPEWKNTCEKNGLTY